MKRPTVLVTGGSRGIGAATARLFANTDFDVCFTYHSNESAARQLVDELTQLDANSVMIKADIGIETDVLRIFETVDREFGTLDVLINNAGILMRQCRVQELDAVRLERILRTNVTGTFLCCREAVNRMSTRQGGAGGCIVNVSSIAALNGSPNEYVDYAASKAAIDTLTRGLALEVATEGIRVNGVRPGPVHTAIHADGGEPDRVDRVARFIPMQRGGQVEEVAEAILWLAQDKSSYVTGTMLDVAGGR